MSSPISNGGQDIQPELPAAVTFPCSTCRKELKIKTALVGKKVKCPHCGQVMLAPAPLELPVAEADDAPGAAAPEPVWKSLLPPFLLALVLWATFVLKLHNLDHTALTRWDEVFHAVVAQNVMKHPLRPTLVDAPYLPYDMKKWGENHVWLHKPILPFWQIALSFTLLGVGTFALRLPSAILSTAAAGLTYLIGKNLFDRRTAVVAASLQAASPFLMTLIHGYQFADHIDVALLFWVEVGVYFLTRTLRNGGWPSLLLAGSAQGLAFLCKSYLAFIILGIALAAWLLPYCRLGKREDYAIGPLRLMAMLGMTIVTVAPWLLFCLFNYPDEFWHEDGQVWRHLGTNIEGWAAPWDRVAFDYLIAMHGVFYTPILVAGIVLVGKAFRERHRGLLLMYAMGLGVILPHLAAVSKTPSATLLALPALLLLLAHLIAEASRGQRGALVALTAVLVMSLVMPAVVRNPGHGFPYPRSFGTIMFQARWVLYHVGCVIVILGAAGIAWWLTPTRWRPVGRYFRWAAQVFCLCVLIWLGFQTTQAAWTVTSRDQNDPACVEVGQFARAHLPENAVLFCDEPKQYEHLMIMFYADRTCYPQRGHVPNESATKVEAAGGVPYLVTRRRLPLPVVFVCSGQGPTVYRWQAQPPH